MIEPFLQRFQWEAKLRRWGCEPLRGMRPLLTAEVWKGPSTVFTVPVEIDGTCEFWAIDRLAKLHGKSPY